MSGVAYGPMLKPTGINKFTWSKTGKSWLKKYGFPPIKFHCITFQNIYKKLHSLKLLKIFLLRWIFKIMMSSRQKTTPQKSSITWEIHIDNWLFISFWHVATLNYQSTCIFVFLMAQIYLLRKIIDKIRTLVSMCS